MAEPIASPDPAALPEPAALPDRPATEGPPDTWDKVFEHRRFKQLNERARAAEQALSEIEATQEKAEKKSLEKRAEYKILYEKSQVELNAERQESLRVHVAIAADLPQELASRLRGANRTEMEADAVSLKKLIKPPTGPGQSPPATSTSPKSLDLSTMTPKEVRKASRGQAINDLFKPAA